MSRMSKWRCFRTVVGCRRLSFDGTDRIVPPGKVSGVSLAVACALSRAPCPCTPIIPSPFHFHTRCGDAMLAYAAAARLPHAALLHTTTCLDGRVDSVTHRPGSATCTRHPFTVRPLPRLSICGLVLDPALRACLPAIQQHTPMPCARGGRRQTWFDSSTSHAPTAWVTAFPSRTAACVPTGRAVASRLQVALLRYATTPPSPSHLALHSRLPSPILPIATKTDCSV